MPTRRSPRKGSLQFWPRKRAAKLLPSANWNAISSKKPLKGLIAYKAAMMSAHVSDETEHSMTKGKKKVIPVTVLECPEARIFSIRLYKDGRVKSEFLAEDLNKELKRKVKLPKSSKPLGEINPEDFDDIRVIIYTDVKKAKIKKTPDILEVGLEGSFEEKLNFVKEKLKKPITVEDVFEKGQLIDVRGVTKGKGLQGPVKRFGINLKSHKSEKGRRRPGSLGPWHPARVIFKVPMAGQMGLFTRVVYNNKIIDLGNEKKFNNLLHYGNINKSYIVVAGSVQGPKKRAVLLTQAMRPTKKQSKKKYELIELR